MIKYNVNGRNCVVSDGKLFVEADPLVAENQNEAGGGLKKSIKKTKAIELPPGARVLSSDALRKKLGHGEALPKKTVGNKCRECATVKPWVRAGGLCKDCKDALAKLEKEEEAGDDGIEDGNEDQS